MTMQTFGVGLIGYGFAGATFHAPLIGAVPGLRITRVMSAQADKVRRDLPHVVVSPQPHELLAAPDVDVVVIAAPNDAHHTLAREALRAGKHVVVDKPFTVTTAQAQDLIALAKSRNRMLSVFHNRRWDGDFITVRHQIEAGALGEINTFVSRLDRHRPEVRARWREQDVPGSGTLYDLGAHLIDQALVLFGAPQTVFADLAAQRAGCPAVDYFHLVLGYGTRRVILHSGSLVRQPGPRFEMHGSRGSLVKHGVDPQEDALRRGERPGGPGWGRDSAQLHATVTTSDGALAARRVETAPGAHHAYYQGVADHLARATAVPVPASDALNVMKVIEHALCSARERRVVDFT